MRRPNAPLTARFLPNCESLETRLTPAVSVTEINGHLLVIDGTVDAEQVAITDDGYGNVTVSAGVGGAALGTFDGITKIRVRMREGADDFDYVRGGVATAAVMPAPKHKPMNLKVDLGWGADHASIDLSAGLDHEKVAIRVKGQADSDQLEASIGGLNQSNLLMISDLGLGDDSFSATIEGDIQGESALAMEVAGRLGNDRLDVDFTSGIWYGDAVVGLYLQGNWGNDEVNVAYTGELRGAVYQLLTGGAGLDKLTSEYNFVPASDGLAALGIYAGSGSDSMTMVNDGINNLEDGVFLVHGALGDDNAIVTPEVILMSVETDTPAVP